jgi:hypothetical protein
MRRSGAGGTSVLLAARSREVGVRPEMLVVDAEQGSRHRSLASQRDPWTLRITPEAVTPATSPLRVRSSDVIDGWG